MATHYSKSSHIGDKATNYIREICTNSEKALFIDSSEKDIGIDAHLDILFENGEPTGAFALIQSKGAVCQWLCKIAESGEASSEAGMVNLLNFKLRMTA